MPPRPPIEHDSPLRRVFEAGRDLYYGVSDAAVAAKYRKCINCPLPVPPAAPGHARAVICLECQEKVRRVGVRVAGGLFETVLDAVTKGK